MKTAAQQAWEQAVMTRHYGSKPKYTTWATLPEIYKAKWRKRAA